MTNRHPDDVVCVATAPNPALAHIWEQALRDEGIQAKVVGDFLDATFGDIPGLQAEVWVHREDLARAEEVIKGGKVSRDDSEEEEEEK